MIQPFLQAKLSEVTRILKENRVTNAYAFGSVCTEQFNEASDVDLLIALDESLDPLEYGQRYFCRAESLARLAGPRRGPGDGTVGAKSASSKKIGANPPGNL